MFKEAMKDYNETCWKPSLGWIKRHWKGYTLFVVSVYAVGYGIGWMLNRWEEHKTIKELNEVLGNNKEES